MPEPAVIVVVSDDADRDAPFVLYALKLAERQLRVDGSTMPASLRHVEVRSVPRPGAASDGQGRTFERARLAAAHDPSVNTPLLLTYEEAGARLGDVSARTVRRMVTDGRLGAVSVGARKFISPAALEAFADDLDTRSA